MEKYARSDMKKSIGGLHQHKVNLANNIEHQSSNNSKTAETSEIIVSNQPAGNQSTENTNTDNQGHEIQAGNTGESDSTDNQSVDNQAADSGETSNVASDNHSATEVALDSGNDKQPTDVVKPKSTRGRKPKVAANGDEKAEMTSISIRLPKRVYNELLIISFREGEKRMELMSPSQLAEEALYKTFKLTK